MPRFKPDAQQVLIRITELNITESPEFFKYFCISKTFAEVCRTQADLTYVKIPDSVLCC